VKPIPNPDAFKSLLIELQRGATDPPLGDVKIETWESSPGDGFIVCLVPPGPFKPYRAEVSGKKQFIMRSLDMFYVPSVAVIRALFYPHAQAVFQVQAILTWTLGLESEPGWDKARIKCFIYIHNQGTVTARDAYIIFQTNLQDLDQPDDTPDWLVREVSSNRMRFEARRSIHPDVTVRLPCLKWQTPTRTASREQNVVVPQMVSGRLVFHFHVEDQAPQRAEIIFDGEQLTERGKQYSQTVTASEA
jgi:hypothetical protein